MYKFVAALVLGIAGLGVQAGEQAPKAKETAKEKVLVPLAKAEKKHLYKQVELNVVACEACEKRSLLGRKRIKGIGLITLTK